MKIFFKKISSLILTGALLFSNTPVFAQNSTAISIIDLLPADLDEVIELDFTQTNPITNFLKESTVFDSAMKTNKTWNPYKQSFEGQWLTTIKDIKENIISGTTTFGLKFDSADFSKNVIITAFNLDEKNYSKFIELSEMVAQESNGLKYYSDETGTLTFMTKLGTQVVFTNNLKTLQDIVARYNKKLGGSLAESLNYKAISQNYVPNNFFKIWIRPGSFFFNREGVVDESLEQNSEMTDMDPSPLLDFSLQYSKKLYDLYLGEVFSIAQQGNQFLFNLSIKGDQVKLSQNKMMLDQYNFVPELYKYFSDQGLIYYQEVNNFKNQIENTLNLITQESYAENIYNDFISNIKEETAIDLKNDVLAVLDGKSSIIINKTDTIVPAFTVMADVKNSSEKAKILVTKLTDYIKKTLSTEEGPLTITNSTTTIAGGSFQKIQFDLAKIPDTNISSNIPPEKTIFTINAGITKNNLLVISTHPHLEKVLSENAGSGLTINEEFKNVFTNPGETINSIAYASINNFKDYIMMLGNDFQAPDGEKATMEKLFEGWGYFYGKTTATNDLMQANGVMDIDLKKILESTKYNNFLKLFLPGSVPYNYDKDIEEKEFCDVKKSDWSYGYIHELHKKQIISGYYNYQNYNKKLCNSYYDYRPSANITRAEFLKILVQSRFHETGHDNPQMFSDIPVASGKYDAEDRGNYWYRDIANFAGTLGIIKGYNGKFEGGKPITRAEAIQILYNLSVKGHANFEWKEVLSAPSENEAQTLDWPFSDISTNNTFYEAIRASYYHQLIEGNTTFRPNDRLNRAEAAKMIKLFNDLY